MPNPLLDPTPQFGTAEYAPVGDRCGLCHLPIGSMYYRVSHAMVCPSCADRVRIERAKDSHAAYVRGLAAGIAAAVAGLIAYAAISILLQGWVISYMSFGVGWLVGAAMMKASGGVGGRRYQIAAVLLTYAAVSMAAIPIWIYFANEHRSAQQQNHQAESQQESERDSDHQPANEPQRPALTLGAWLGRVAMLGLASPFLQLKYDPFWGAMGVIVLFVGIRIAWRMTAGRPVEVLGPFNNSPQPAV